MRLKFVGNWSKDDERLICHGCFIWSAERANREIMDVKRNRVAIAVLSGVFAAGLIGASAATLGGLSGAGLGSDDQIVASCDTDGITTGYTTSYNATAQYYEVTAVNFTSVNAACNAKAALVSLRNGVTNLGSTSVGSITVAGNAFSITLSSPIQASLVTGLSLLISG
ncbi:MAG: hypothetical protein OEY70_01255 [Acidimicrobiia bacterium]|nr:hypothetical protein [Acidimicrobiia bacterium]